MLRVLHKKCQLLIPFKGSSPENLENFYRLSHRIIADRSKNMLLFVLVLPPLLKIKILG
jgi:hypothetical protein